MIKFPPIINHAYIMLTEQCNLRCEYCVSGDTLITMSDMSRKPIKEINVGDEILSINENVKNNNKFLTFEKTYVSKIFKPRYVEKLYHIIMNDGNNLYITGEHPLLTSRKKWITVEKLKIKKKNEQKIYTTLFPNNKCNENKITNYDKRFRKYMINSIESITEIDYNDYVYNIETGNHTYIANNIIVHNCYIKNRDAKNEFSYDWIETLKNSFTCLNKPRLIFFGGEPLLKIDLIKRIVDNYKNDFQFQVVTNGTVNLHKFINEIYKPNKSIFDIQISWDGNNNTRKTASKKSTNDIVYNNIINELENGGAFEARCVINDESVNYMFNTYKTFKEFYFKYPFSGDFTIAHQLSFNDDFSIKLGKELEKIYNDIILQLDTDNFFMPRFLLKIITNILQNIPVISCDIGTHVVIKPNGDIYPCTILSQQDERFKLGNIKTYVDTEIITKLRTPASCQKNCQFKNVCDGGCRYERIKLFPNDWECKVCNHTCKIYEIIYLKSKEFLDKIDENRKDKLLKYINEYNLWSIDYVDCLTDNSKRIF